LEAEPTPVKVPQQLVCGGCGAGLALGDARPIDCPYCNARNFLGDALAAAIHGRTAPREVVVLLGREHTTRLPEGITTMLVDGEPLSVGPK
jgi:hypothetical protein